MNENKEINSISMVKLSNIFSCIYYFIYLIFILLFY